MAPRARRRKRDKRMDAAVDAMMKLYGFSDEELVKKVANELLNEYGGEDGWFFIEQYSYLELLEAILRYQEENPQENNRQESSAGGGDSVEGRTADDYTPTDAAGTSSAVAEPEDAKHLPSTERDGKGWKDIGLDQSCSQREIGITRPDTSPLLSLLPATAVSGTRRRFPCYGWIDSDEEDIDDFIELKPATEVTAATTAESWEYPSSGMNSKAKRRSRWDLRPDDP